MTIIKEAKKKIITDFKVHGKDTGSAPVQIAILTERINGLSGHFKVHKKDKHSRRGLLELINRRRKLLGYLKKHDAEKYQEVLERLKLRK